MWKIFEKQVKEDKVITKNKTINEIIDEIHESFNSEVDKLLAESKILKSNETELQDLIDKSKKLRDLGFTNTKECKDADLEIQRLNTINNENKSKKELNRAINYFTQKYPLYKFITEESVIKICNKYNLVYGPVDRYEGTVPDKNLKDISNFKVDEEDACYYHKEEVISLYGRNRITNNSISRKLYLFNTSKEISIERSKNNYHTHSYYINEIYDKSPLEIAAPVKDFNMEGYEVEGVKISKIHIPDPVVLFPVFYENKKHYLVVTAWGQEASDELVVNQKFN